MIRQPHMNKMSGSTNRRHFIDATATAGKLVDLYCVSSLAVLNKIGKPRKGVAMQSYLFELRFHARKFDFVSRSYVIL